MIRTVFFILLVAIANSVYSQNKQEKLSLDDVIRISKVQSLKAIIARNKFQAGYWQYRSYKASRLPSLMFSGILPNFNNNIQRTSTYNTVTQSIQYEFGRNNSITNMANLSLNQNIALTGGTFSVMSELQRNVENGTRSSTQYLSIPINFKYTQPLFGYNGMKWDKKIEPLLYVEAQKNYLKDLEDVSLQAISNFFDLALAQLNLNIAQVNFTNTDTLYQIAKGRYNIGTIAQNDVLQMELTLLNARTDLNLSKVNLEMQKSKLSSFLGYSEKMDFDLVLPDNIPTLELDCKEVFNLSLNNNPDVIAMERQLLEASKNVAQAKGQQRGRSVNLIASYGQSQQADNIPMSYKNPSNQQQVQLSITLPIIDWGLGRGKVKMAESNQKMVNSQVQQAHMDFEQNVFLQVMQFNLQGNQVAIASKADTIAQMRYDVTKQRFLIGKIAILDLNVAQSDKDQAKRGYENALRNYWSYFYTLRQLTLFDFVRNQALYEEYEMLIQ